MLELVLKQHFSDGYVSKLKQIPIYYSNIDFSQTGDNLKNQLTTLITNTHIINLPYTATGITDVWDALSQTDLNPNNSLLKLSNSWRLGFLYQK